MNPILIRQASPEDYKSVAAIGKNTFYESWIHMHSEEDMQSYMAEAFEENKIKADLSNPANTFLLAEVDGENVGYVKLRTDRIPPSSNWDPILLSIEMERIYVLKKHQDKKIGKALMDNSLEICMAEGYECLWLAVNKYNNKAINFYNRYGFTIFGTKTFKVGATINEDFLMKLLLRNT